ncbi:MAG: peptide deformylase [Symbiobacteriaceae bacterium]|nr:peptide deformylase [Symbiobacteriaceae bacterium]
MAIRTIRGPGSPELYVKAKEVTSINPGVLRLLDDMAETMRANAGLGLAAPQLGIAKRIIVIEYEGDFYEMINPILVEEEGELIDIEGCLSYPGVWAEVARPQSLVIAATNRLGEAYQVEAEGVLARALRHEMDHLEGEVFVDKIIRYIDPSELEGVGESPSIRAVFEYRKGEG